MLFSIVLRETILKSDSPLGQVLVALETEKAAFILQFLLFLLGEMQNWLPDQQNKPAGLL